MKTIYQVVEMGRLNTEQEGKVAFRTKKEAKKYIQSQTCPGYVGNFTILEIYVINMEMKNNDQ